MISTGGKTALPALPQGKAPDNNKKNIKYHDRMQVTFKNGLKVECFLLIFCMLSCCEFIERCAEYAKIGALFLGCG
jgi:hypothetical protein